MDNRTASTFSHFQELPKELRRHVWIEFFLESSTVTTPAILNYMRRGGLWVGRPMAGLSEEERVEAVLPVDFDLDEYESQEPGPAPFVPEFQTSRLDRILIRPPVMASVCHEARAVVVEMTHKLADVEQCSPWFESVDGEAEQGGRDIQHQQQQQQQKEEEKEEENSEVQRVEPDMRCLFARKFDPCRDVLFLGSRDKRRIFREVKGSAYGLDTYTEEGRQALAAPGRVFPPFHILFHVRTLAVRQNFKKFSSFWFSHTRLERLFILGRRAEIPRDIRRTGDGLDVSSRLFTPRDYAPDNGTVAFAHWEWDLAERRFITNESTYITGERELSYMQKVGTWVGKTLAECNIERFGIYLVTMREL